MLWLLSYAEVVAKARDKYTERGILSRVGSLYGNRLRRQSRAGAKVLSQTTTCHQITKFFTFFDWVDHFENKLSISGKQKL